MYIFRDGDVSVDSVSKSMQANKHSNSDGLAHHVNINVSQKADISA